MINGHKIFLVVAVDEQYGIGKNGTLAWRLKKEMRHFTYVTTQTTDQQKQNAVIMGRATWESIPDKFRPLPNRMNIVLTSDASYNAPGATIVSSYDSALEQANDTIENIYIIGGARVYEQALPHAATDGVYLTHIHHDFSCDTFFPQLPPAYSHTQLLSSDEENGITFDVVLYTK